MFLADRFDQFVCSAQLDPAELIENLHHFFLIDHDSVGLFKNCVLVRMDLGHRLGAVPIAGELVVMELERPGRGGIVASRGDTR